MVRSDGRHLLQSLKNYTRSSILWLISTRPNLCVTLCDHVCDSKDHDSVFRSGYTISADLSCSRAAGHSLAPPGLISITSFTSSTQLPRKNLITILSIPSLLRAPCLRPNSPINSLRRYFRLLLCSSATPLRTSPSLLRRLLLSKSFL